MLPVTVSYSTQKGRLSLENKRRTKRGYFSDQIYTGLTSIFLVCALLIWSACGEESFQPISDVGTDEIKLVLADRSFRQFSPNDINADPRKAVVLNFFDGVRLWAQYAEGDQAINEWGIFAADYHVEKTGSGSEIKIYFNKPTSERILPTRCLNCIETSGISISIRAVLDSNRISFKLNDPNNSLPSPFPVFQSWTKFREDEYSD